VKVFIAGATGVLGRSLVPKLVAAGHEPRLLVRDMGKATALFGRMPVELHQGDLLAPAMESKLAPLMDGCEAVMHIATAIPRDFTVPGALTANTHLRIRGTGRLQRAALEVNATSFVQQSIITAYRDGGDEWLDENTWIDQSPERNSICHPVAIMESMLRLFRKQSKPMRWTILKAGTFVGPATFQADLVERIRSGKEVVPGDGSHFVSLVHIEDVADAYVKAMERAPEASIFNICAEPLRYAEYVDRIADMLGMPHPRRDLSLPPPPSHRASTHAAAEILGWQARCSIWPSV
jgi:nucleoside-diphosphate-sugar epimerase